MRYTEESGELLFAQSIAPNIYNFTLKAPQIAAVAAAGQFVMVLCGERMLRRPISLCGFDAKLGILRLVFEVRGDGTRWLSEQKEGAHISLIGPLGHGFPLLTKDTHAVLVGGGIGTPPLLSLARYYGQNAALISGFRTADAVILQQDAVAAGAQTVLCTDDGTAGMHGFTTVALEHYLADHPCDVIYTCGPAVMMKAVAAIAGKHGILCYVSMEERMGCGVGACLGCTCPTIDKEGNEQRTRVCLNGPVFDSKEVVWA